MRACAFVCVYLFCYISVCVYRLKRVVLFRLNLNSVTNELNIFGNKLHWISVELKHRAPTHTQISGLHLRMFGRLLNEQGIDRELFQEYIFVLVYNRMMRGREMRRSGWMKHYCVTSFIKWQTERLRLFSYVFKWDYDCVFVYLSNITPFCCLFSHASPVPNVLLNMTNPPSTMSLVLSGHQTMTPTLRHTGRTF